MKRKKRKLNSSRILVAILIILIIIAALILLVKKQKTNEIIANSEETKTASTEPKEEKPTNTLEVNVNKNDNKEKKDIDFLANLKVPVYKKSEKNIKIPTLIYHAFRTPIPKEDTYKLFSSQEKFDENVKTLLDNGYTFITLEELYQYNNGEIGLPEKVIIITMDDGWIGCYTEAYQVLQKYKVPATMFIVNQLVGTTDYFSWEQAKEMYDSGLVKIHCHGYSHIDYTKVSKEKLQSDYNKAHNEIQEHLQDNNIQKMMAYPAGDSSKTTIASLKEIGFKVQIQTKYGTVNKSSNLDLTNLGRIRAERATGKQLISTINAATTK